MNIDEILEHAHSKNGVEETMPFDKNTLVLKVGGKMFLLLSLEKSPLHISVKTDPEKSIILREQYPQIMGAYHMNKLHWNTLILEGLKAELVKELIDHSYDLVFSSLSKKIKLSFNL